MTMQIAEVLDVFFPNEKYEVLMNPLIFGNFKNALSEDDVPRLYEDYETYDVIYKIFEDVIKIF